MQRSAVVWGTLLILLGGLFLMDGLGFLLVNVWTVLIPLSLVGAGLYIILSTFGRPEAPSVEHLTMELKGAETAEIVFYCHGGRLAVSGDAPPIELLSGTFIGGVEYKALDKGNARVQLELRMRDIGSGNVDRDWRVALNPDLPLAIRLMVSDCQVTADLQAMQVHELIIEARAGDVEVTLPAAAGFTKVSVDHSHTPIVLRILEGVAASIQRTAVSGASVSDVLRFIPTGDRFESDGYEMAANRIEIVAAGTAGSVAVV